MTLKVRDEEDILEANLRFHLAQGVDFFVVTDNGSRDATPRILRRYAQAGLADVTEDPAEEFPTPRWVNDMARRAATEHGADWVINSDADEFWWPLGGTLRSVFASLPEPYTLLNAPRPEFVGRPDGPGSFAERLTVREARSRLQHKVAHRGFPDVVVGEGAHRVELESEASEGVDRHSGRAVLRGVSPGASLGWERRLVPAPSWPVRILHFPVRSFDQFRHRVELLLFHGGYEARGHRDDRGRRLELRRHHEEGRLFELYAEMVWDDVAVAEGLKDGSLVTDAGLRDFLAGCPDPLGEGGPASARSWGERAMALEPERLEAELAANALDMMSTLHRADASIRRQRRQANARAERFKSERDELSARARELERERDRLAAELELARGRPAARARALAQRALRRS